MSSDSSKMLQEEFEASNNVSWGEEALPPPTPTPTTVPVAVAMENNVNVTELELVTAMKEILVDHDREDNNGDGTLSANNVETLEDPENQRTTAPPKRIIPFDYDEFCADIPESMQPYFQACSKQLKTSNLNTNSELGSPVQYLEVPKLVYGRRQNPIDGINTIRRLNFNGCSGSESESSDMESMNRNEKNNNGLEMKKPLALKRKKIHPQMPPPPPPVTENSSCSIM